MFHKLSHIVTHLKKIVDLLLESLKKQLKEQGVELTLTDSAKEKITEVGYDPEYGARPLRRAIQKHVEDLLSEELLRGTVKPGQHVTVDVEEDEFKVKASVYS